MAVQKLLALDAESAGSELHHALQEDVSSLVSNAVPISYEALIATIAIPNGLQSDLERIASSFGMDVPTYLFDRLTLACRDFCRTSAGKAEPSSDQLVCLT